MYSNLLVDFEAFKTFSKLRMTAKFQVQVAVEVQVGGKTSTSHVTQLQQLEILIASKFRFSSNFSPRRVKSLLTMSSFTSATTTAVFELLSKETKSDKGSSKATNADSNITASVISMVQKEPKIVGDVLRKLVEMVRIRFVQNYKKLTCLSLGFRRSKRSKAS